MLTDQPYPSSPRFVRIAAAASRYGVSVHSLTVGIEDGSIPVTMRKIGGLRLVNLDQLAAWFHVGSEVDLFTEQQA